MNTWNMYQNDIVCLSDDETKEVSGGPLHLVYVGAVIAATWTAGYTMGKDRAKRDNRNP